MLVTIRVITIKVIRNFRFRCRFRPKFWFRFQSSFCFRPKFRVKNRSENRNPLFYLYSGSRLIWSSIGNVIRCQYYFICFYIYVFILLYCYSLRFIYFFIFIPLYFYKIICYELKIIIIIFFLPNLTCTWNVKWFSKLLFMFVNGADPNWLTEERETLTLIVTRNFPLNDCPNLFWPRVNKKDRKF